MSATESSLRRGAAVAALVAGSCACGAGPAAAAARAPNHERIAMQCRAELVERAPLTIHFSLVHPATAAEPTWVPRVLQPLGAFVVAELRDATGAVVWNTERPKFHPKLDPESREAYVELDPGYSHGVVLVLRGAELGAGAHTLHLTYRNLQYRGVAGHALGDQACAVTLPIVDR